MTFSQRAVHTYEGALGFLKVTVFVSVRRVKSLLPPKSHRSLSMTRLPTGQRCRASPASG